MAYAKLNQILSAGILFFAANGAGATVINVPATQPTIMGGITAAQAGDTVLVAPGTYFENINFQAKAITVTSSGGPGVTIIDGGGIGPVATFNNSEGNKSILAGFTLRNGTSTFDSSYAGGGIYIASASPIIFRNLITNNTACAEGGGIGMFNGSPLILQNVIVNNSQSGCSGGPGGAGIAVIGGSPAILANVIADNVWASGSGGGVTLWGAASPILFDNIIFSNNASGGGNGQGGGIWIVNAGSAFIEQNLIFGNTADQGGGVMISVPSGSAGPTLINNTIAGNHVTLQQGSAVYVNGFDTQTEFLNNLLIGETGTSAVFCDQSYTSLPPKFMTNDAFSPGGIGMDGTCVGEISNFGNFSADPHFVDPAHNNYQLQDGSPAIDVGTNSPLLPPKDLAGRPRIADGDHDGDLIVDLGVFEHP